MKKLALIAICVAALCAFAACTTSRSTPEPEATETDIEEAPTIVEQVAPEEDPDLIDHDDAIKSLGYLLDGPDWAKAEDLSIENLVAWYANDIKMSNADDADFMNQYFVEGEDETDSGIFFPAKEFEEAITATFDIEPALLRENLDIYDEEAETYKHMGSLVDLMELNATLSRVAMNGEEHVIFFELKVPEAESTIRALTVVKENDNIRFVSYTNEDGTVSAPVVDMVGEDIESEVSDTAESETPADSEVSTKTAESSSENGIK